MGCLRVARQSKVGNKCEKRKSDVIGTWLIDVVWKNRENLFIHEIKA